MSLQQTKPAEDKHDTDRRNLSGQQVSAMQKQMQDLLTYVLKDIELRKYALGRAADCAVEQVKVDPKAPVDVMALAREMHKFLIESATSEIKGIT